MAEIKKLIGDKTVFSPAEAATLLPKISLSKFAGSAELTVNLKLKAKQANESIRGSLVFPHSFGEQKKILVFAEAEKQNEAKEAGADYVGLEDLVTKVNDGWVDFDVVIATPMAMPKIARLGKVLGPKQLMPNPKTGTVTMKLADAISDYKSGKVDFKMDAGKSIKVRFAKLSQNDSEVLANLEAALETIKNETKRLGVNVISSVYVSPSMGPSLKLSL